jgi:hypothetical protein
VVAITSDSACAPLARCFTEMDTADSANMRFAVTAPVTQPARQQDGRTGHGVILTPGIYLSQD